MQISDKYKTWLKHGPLLLENRDEKARSTDDTRKLSKWDIFKEMYTIDYHDNPYKANSTFFAQQSFTILDWIFAHKLLKNETTMAIDDLPEKNIFRLVFNVFPGGETFFHKIIHKVETQLIAKINTKKALHAHKANLFTNNKVGIEKEKCKESEGDEEGEEAKEKEKNEKEQKINNAIKLTGS